MADITPQELKDMIDRLEARANALESAPGFWAGLDERIKANPKIMVFMTMLLSIVGTWFSTYFSKPETRDVPGPERVIERHLPGPTIIKEVPAKPAPVKPKVEHPPPVPVPMPPVIEENEFISQDIADEKAMWIADALVELSKRVFADPAAQARFDALIKKIRGNAPVPPPPPDEVTTALAKLTKEIAALNDKLTDIEKRLKALEDARPPPIPTLKVAHVTFIGPEKTMASLTTANDLALRTWLKDKGVKVHVFKSGDAGIKAGGFVEAVTTAGGEPCAVLQDAKGNVITSISLTDAQSVKTAVIANLGGGL